MPKIILLFIIFLYLQNICFAYIPCQEINLFQPAIVNNVLNLSEEQIKLKSYNYKAFKKCLTNDQRIKLNMIRKLEKENCKKSKKQPNYYKSNPQMNYFGDPKTYSKIK